MSTPAVNLVEMLHSIYCMETGQAVGRTYQREFAWTEFITRGFTITDLQDVIRDIRRAIGRGERRPEALKFSNLIQDVDRFEEQLAMLRSRQRAARPAPAVSAGKAEVLRATGRSPETAPPQGAKTLGELITKLKEVTKL